MNVMSASSLFGLVSLYQRPHPLSLSGQLIAFPATSLIPLLELLSRSDQSIFGRQKTTTVPN